MKRKLLLLLMFLPVLASAYDAEIDGIYYNFSGNEAEVTYRKTNYTSYSGAVVIPASVTYNGKTYSVTSIGDEAFWGCSGLTSVTIPNSVTSIGGGAFGSCSGLTSVTIPNSVTSIGYYAFELCSGLTSVTIGNGVTSIGNFAFYGCSGLTSLTIGNGVTSIGGQAFWYCSSLTSVTIPNSVTSIGGSAFSGCSGLTSINVEEGNTTYDSRNDCNAIIETATNTFIAGCKNTVIPNSVTSIGDKAFWGCSGLTSVTIPNSVTSIGGDAFRDCSGLTSVTIGNGVTSIGGWAFYDCRGLTSVTIPNSVTSIGGRAFYGCSGLTSVTIGDGVTSIGYEAFCDCSSLKSLTIGNSVSSIDGSAFNSTSIKKVIWLTKTPPSGYRNVCGSINYVSNNYFSGLSNVKVYPFLNSMFEINGVKYVPVSPSERTCDAIDCAYDETVKSVNISSFTHQGITFNIKNVMPYLAYDNKYIETLSIDAESNISNCAFYNCSNIKSVTFNEKITGIGDYTFYGCGLLEAIEIPDSVKLIGANAFQNCTRMLTVVIGKNCTQIGNQAFYSCFAIQKITSKAQTPPICGTQALEDINKWTSQLYVPKGTLAAYQTADQWKDFFFVTEEGGGTEPTEKCVTPTISYVNGKLTFNSDTEDVVFHSTITDTDITSYLSKDVELGVTYTITVYATKEGYIDSDVATATLCWIDVEPATEGIVKKDDATEVKEVKAVPVLIQTQGGTVTIQGAAEGTPIAIYDTSGKQYGSATSEKDRTTISTSLRPGSVAIVKIGEKSVKVAIK